jgi:hypothetical protein
MDDEQPRRNLHERTGKHLCIRCMSEVTAEEYFRNDFFCDACAAEEESFPLESTPGETRSDET